MMLVTKTTTYEIAKNLDIGLKLSGYDHMSNFLFFLRPVRPVHWSFVMTFHDHGHQIQTHD